MFDAYRAGFELLCVVISGGWSGITLGNHVADAAGWPRRPIRNLSGAVIVR